MEMKKYKLTQKHIEKFKEYLHMYVYDLFHLSQYDIEIFIKHSDNAYYSTCCADDDSCMVAFQLNTTWQGLEPTPAALSRIAFHESCELLLWTLWSKATDRYTTKDEMETARHSVITTLENRFYKEYLS